MLKTTLLALTLSFSLSLSLSTVALAQIPKAKIIHIKDLELMLKKPADLSVFDVNVNSTRENVGIIPGAHMIDSASKYDLAKTLPTDKKSSLVFYCANDLCTSSDEAAARAVGAGYTNVSVMKDGIYGWKKAGQKIEKVAGLKSSTEGASNVEPAEAAALVEQKHAVIIDVRESEERHEIIPGALWFPMSKAGDTKAWDRFKSEIPKGETAILHCASGIRSKKLADRLIKEGVHALYFTSADQWKTAGLPVEKGPASLMN